MTYEEFIKVQFVHKVFDYRLEKLNSTITLEDILNFFEGKLSNSKAEVVRECARYSSWTYWVTTQVCRLQRLGKSRQEIMEAVDHLTISKTLDDILKSKGVVSEIEIHEELIKSIFPYSSN